MAHLLRRPLCSAVGTFQPSAFQSTPFPRRCFSQFAPLCVGLHGPQSMRPKQKADRSVRIMNKELQQLPQDTGILPGTFIPPTGTKAPSIFRQPKRYLKLKYRHLRFRFRDFASLIINKYSDSSDPHWFKRKLKIANGTLVPTALALHRQMYSAFAEGDLGTLKAICADGLYESFERRLEGRKRGEKLAWELVSYTSPAKVVSNRCGRFPVDGMSIRQAVVRIRSQQSLAKVGGRGTGVKTFDEYLVIQQMYTKYQPQEWMLWGTVPENTLEDVETWDKEGMD